MRYYRIEACASAAIDAAALFRQFFHRPLERLRVFVAAQLASLALESI
jgi:hypothetical protein